MKACFLLQRRFAYVGHKMAVILQEKYGIKEFCGYVYTRSSYEFLKEQKDVHYTSLILDEEIHKSYKDEKLDLEYLKKLEKEYGLPNLWPYITIDRVIMHNMLVREYPYDKSRYNHEEMMRILQIKAKAIIEFLDREKPDFIFITVIGGIGTMLLYHIAKKKNIKIILGKPARMGYGYILSDNYKNLSYAEKIFNDLIVSDKDSKKRAEAQEYINDFRKKLVTYLNYTAHDPKINENYRLRPLKWFVPKYFWRSLSWFIKLCYYYFSGKKTDHTDQKPLGYFIDRVKRKTRIAIGFNHLYDKVDMEEDFAFYPLHLEPEIATLLFAPFWSDQINLIKQIAKSLPLYFKLYVKEHPAMVGNRTHAYYKELKKIPNLKLIDPDTNIFDLIRNTKLVVTITSTVGWEAVLFKKPLITFGDVYYNRLSTVKKCETIKELPYLVKEQLENFKYDERELENFVGAIMEESVKVGMEEIWVKGVKKEEAKERLTRLVDLMAKKLNIEPLA